MDWEDWAIGAFLGLLLLGGVGLLVWAVRDEDSRCRTYEASVLAVSHNDPEDFPGILRLYAQECGS